MTMFVIVGAVAVVIFMLVSAAVKIVQEYERGVIFRLGRLVPSEAVVKAIDFVRATSLVGQTTLRSILGQSDLDHLLSERDKINQRLQEVIDQQTSQWGVKVTSVPADID